MNYPVKISIDDTKRLLLFRNGIITSWTIADFDNCSGWLSEVSEYEFSNPITIEGPCAFYGGPFTPNKWTINGGLCTMGAASYSHSPLPNQLVVGRYCSIAKGLKFLDFSHPTSWLSSSVAFFIPAETKSFSALGQYIDRSTGRDIKTSKRETFDTKFNRPYPIIENDVWIGENVTLGMGIHIGTGSVIASGSIVTRDVPPYAIVAGVPATVKKYRFDPELIKSLLASEWWKYSYKDLLELNFKNPGMFLEQFLKQRDSGNLQEWKPNAIILPDVLIYST